MKKILIHLLKPLSFLPAILMMYLIYSFSAQTGEVSGALSYEVSYQIVETKKFSTKTKLMTSSPILPAPSNFMCEKQLT